LAVPKPDGLRKGEPYAGGESRPATVPGDIAPIADVQQIPVRYNAKIENSGIRTRPVKMK
jgi:hypothetical protein